MVLLVALLGMSRAGLHGTATRARRAGRVEGTVVISKSLSAHRPRFRIYAGDGAALMPPAGDTVDERRNVVLYLVPAAAAASDADAGSVADHAVVRQRDERFAPHVVVVRRGATVDFPNEDAVFHNVFSLSSAKEFDLGRYPRGSSKSLVFERPGVVQVFCHIHADMSAIVLVLENSLFAQPDSSGRFVIDDVPPGEYTVVGWHERIRPVTHVIRVQAGHTSAIDFNIPLPAGGARER